MNRRTRAIRKLKSSLRSLSAVAKEIEQLRDWVERGAEVIFAVPFVGSSLQYVGWVVDTTMDGSSIPTFMFISQSGMRALLTPQFFPKSSVEKTAGVRNGIHVEDKTRGSNGFAIVEYLFEKKSDPKLPSVLEKLRTWEKLHADLHVLLNQSGHAISFFAQVREISSGTFSFTRTPAPIQLLIRVEDYKQVDIKMMDNKSVITLIDPRAEEMCVITDAPTQPETLFRKFAGVSRTIH